MAIGSGVGYQVVGHDRGRLLRTRHGVGQGQHQLVGGRGGKAELAMGVLADANAQKAGKRSQDVQAAERADPVAAEADDIGHAAGDHLIGVGGTAQALVGA